MPDLAIDHRSTLLPDVIFAQAVETQRVLFDEIVSGFYIFVKEFLTLVECMVTFGAAEAGG